MNKWDKMAEAIREAFPKAEGINMIITTTKESDKEFSDYCKEVVPNINEVSEEKIENQIPLILLKFKYIN